MGEVVTSIPGYRDFSMDVRKAFPVLWLPLVDIPEDKDSEFSKEAFSQKVSRQFLWDILDSSVHRQMKSPLDLKESLGRLLEPDLVPRIWSFLCTLNPTEMCSFKENLADIMAWGMLPYKFDYELSYTAKLLLQWLFQSRPHMPSLSFSHVSRGFPRAIEKMKTQFLWKNERLIIHPSSPDVAQRNFPWLLFILKEIDIILASEDDMKQHRQLLEHIETCITTLQLFAGI